MAEKESQNKDRKEYWWGCNNEVYCGEKNLGSLLNEIEIALEEDGTDTEYTEKDGYWVVEVKRLPFVAKMTREVRIL